MPYHRPEGEEELYPLNQTTAPTQPPVQENILGRGAPALAPTPAPAPSQIVDNQSLAPAPYQPSAVPPPAQQAQPLQSEPEYENILGRYDRPEKVESGFLADVASATGRGIGRAVESTGAGLEVLGADVTGKFYKEKGRELAESDLLRPDDSERAGKDGTVKRTFLSALESLPSSMVPLITGTAGAAIGSLAGPGGALYGGYTGGAAGLGVTFGAGTYGLEKERYLKEKAESGLSAEQLETDAHDFALSQSLWETIPEAASDIFMAGTFGVSKLLTSGLGATGATATLKGLLAQGPKEFAKQFGKAYLKSMPVEALSEMVTYWGQATGDKDAGLGDGPIAQGFIDAAATAAWLTLGMGGGMSVYSQRAKSRIAKAIQSNNPIMRGRAADRIQEGLVKEYGAERAQEWRDSAERMFAAGGTIDMSSPIFNAIQETDTRDTEAGTQAGIMTRALSSVGESVEVGNETVTPRQIKKMEQENTIAGKIAAGIPLTEEEEYSRYSPDVPRATPAANAPTVAQESVAGTEPRQTTDKLGKEISSAIPIMMRDLASGEAGRRLRTPDPNEAPYSADAGATIRQPSSFPAWITKDKIISKAGKKNIEKIVARAIAGEEGSFTPRQADLWEKIKSAAKEEYNTNPELLSGQEADKLSAEGFELGATEDISVGNLNPGDEVVIADSAGIPDKLVHKGFDDDGNAILKDGVTMRVDPFEQISIIGKKIGPEGDAVSQRMLDFVVNVNSETSPAIIRRLIKDSPGMLAGDKALAPYADMIKGSLERRITELDPDQKKVVEKKKDVAEAPKKDKLSERAKKRKKEKESPQVKEKSEKPAVGTKMASANSEPLTEQYTEKLSAEGFDLGVIDDFTVDSLMPGDEVVTTDAAGIPGRMIHKGYDKDGNVIFLKDDGATIKVGPFKQISIIGSKIWPEGHIIAKRVSDFFASINEQASPVIVREVIKDFPGLVTEDKAMAPYAEYIKGFLERKLVEFDPVKGKTADKDKGIEKKKKIVSVKVAKKENLKKRTTRPNKKAHKDSGIKISEAVPSSTDSPVTGLQPAGRLEKEESTPVPYEAWMKLDKVLARYGKKKIESVIRKEIFKQGKLTPQQADILRRANLANEKYYNEIPGLLAGQEADKGKIADKVGKNKAANGGAIDPSTVAIDVSSVGETHSGTANVVSGWLSVFEPRADRPINIRILTRQEVLDNIDNQEVVPVGLKKRFSNKHNKILSKRTEGFRWSKGKQHIIISESVSGSSLISLRNLSTLAHEVGHVIQAEFFDNAPSAVKESIVEAHRQWVSRNKEAISEGKLLRRTRLSIGHTIGSKKNGRFVVGSTIPSGQPKVEYYLSFNEWFANETAKALTSQETPISVVEKFFADMADLLRKLVKKIAGTSFMPDAAVANFVLGGDMIFDDKVAAAEGNETNVDTGSLDLFYDPTAPMSPRVKGMLKEAKAGPSEEKYTSYFEGKHNETSARYASRQTGVMIRDARATVDKFLGTISSRIKKWSPELEKRLRRMEIGIIQKIHDMTAEVEPLMKITKEKMSPKDYSDWQLARYDSDKKKIDQLVKDYGIEAEYKAARSALGKLKDMLTDAGFDIGNIDEYWPRAIKDTPGLLREMERGDMRPVFSDALKEKARQMGLSNVSELTDEERAKVASSVILGKEYGQSGPTSSKKRVFNSIPEELIQYYFDPDAAMIAHIKEAVTSSEYRKFFGKTGEKMAVVRKRLEKVEKKLSGKDISAEDRIELEDVAAELRQTLTRNEQGDFTQPIGMLVAELEAQGLAPEGQKEIRDTLMARLHERGTTGALRAYKNLSLIDTMGSYASALTQIGDFASPMYNAGLFETGRALGKAIAGKQRISAKEVGIDNIAEEFTDSGKIGAAVNKIFELTGLSKMNLVARDTFLNAAFEQFKKEAIADPARLKAKIKPLFLNETDSVVQDLLNDDVTDNVRLLVFDRLLDFQPVTKSEMPEKYLTAGNGRLFYSLKSYTIKQFDIYRREIVTGLKSDSRQERVQALKNMARLGMFLVLANASADELKDFLHGRESTLSDRVVDNILRLGGISRFVTWQARREGVGSAAAKQILPPFKFVDSLTRDVLSAGDDKGLKTLDSVPIVGKLAYWWWGAGADKKHDIWEIRYGKEKRRINKFNDRLEKAKSKKEFIADNREDFILSRRIKKFQSRLDRNRKRINKLESLEPSKKVRARIDLLKDSRSKMTEEFLGKI